MMHTNNRRAFLQYGLGAGLCLARSPFAVASESVRAVAPSPFEEYRDEVTGAAVRKLTQGDGGDSIVYQTHPMWTAGMQRMIIHSRRGGYSAPHAIDMQTGDISPVTESPVGMFVLARKSDQLYFLDSRDVKVAVVAQSLQPSKTIATLPKWVDGLLGGMSLDADENSLYTSVMIKPDTKWGLLKLDLSSGEWMTFAPVDFKTGHVQANPFRSGEVMFCHETGGDAPQRIWLVDFEENQPRPAYQETYNEWVTHEAWWGPDRMIFTIWPYDDEHKQKPHGILSANVRTGEATLHCQYPAWHTQGSPNGKWIMGDDFDRNIWLIEAKGGERRLLTQGHLGKGMKTHPHGSFTPDSKAIVFNSSRGGYDNIYCAMLPDDVSSLPLAD